MGACGPEPRGARSKARSGNTASMLESGDTGDTVCSGRCVSGWS